MTKTKFFTSVIDEVAEANEVSVFEITDPEPEEVVFRREERAHIETPVSVRGIYMTSWVAGSPRLRDRVVDLIETTQINSVVIDIKDYTGHIAFDIDNKDLKKLGSFEKRVSDIEDFVQELHDKGIYVIGRIVVFQDPQFAELWPKEAVQNMEGEIWTDRRGVSWVDPSSSSLWEYIAILSKEAHKMGFDEINYDYVRFPTDGDLSDIVYQLSGERLLEEDKADIIREFFTYLDKEVRSKGVPISADLFGLTTVVNGDIGIGQILENISPFVDYISPMVYPSHFALGWNGYENPAEYPYEVIYETMISAREKLIAIGEDPLKLRPWLQDFDLGASYGTTEVQAQIQAVYDAGLTSWMMWDPSNRYTKEAYEIN
jgi:hypothetical protein